MHIVSCLSFIALAANAAPSVKASIVRRSASLTGTGETTLAVVVQPTELVLGAYQGRLRFQPGALSVVSAVSPDGDRMSVLNAADTAKGVIKFAAFTVSGFKTPDVLVLVVRAVSSLDNAKLTVDLDVVTDLQGKAVPASRLIPARGISGEPGRH